MLVDEVISRQQGAPVTASTLAERLQSVLDDLSAKEGRPVSARELARRAGLKSEVHVGLMLRGKVTRPRVDILRQIAVASGVELDWLSSGEGPRRSTGTDDEYRYASLRMVLEHPSNRGRWSDEAIAAVKTKALKFDGDPGEEYWTEQLDRFHQAVKLADLPPKITVRVDPLDDLDRPKG